MARKGTDWLSLWFEDKESILNTMVRNLQADLNAGYNYFGNTIIREQNEIAEYKAKFDKEVDKLKEMEPSKANHWCYCDLRKRGAIA